MNGGEVRLLVERQDAVGAGWHPVACCNSVEYARMIAAAGVRRGLGASYRVVHRRTGKEFRIGPRVRAAIV
ncbi:MAG TPA: hypothetical protein VHA11_11500 [Bryobacteraceae bacterium]|nr:hypothetical protein [Bryobacteraceae bacterium]